MAQLSGHYHLIPREVELGRQMLLIYRRLPYAWFFRKGKMREEKNIFQRTRLNQA